MPARVSKVIHEYAGRQIKVGETFDVHEADVDLMLAIGRIERMDTDRVPDHVSSSMAAEWPNGYSTRAMTARRSGYKTKAA